ncbi:MAG: ribonuclease III [Gammaproteobacteria bacterium]|nr:ribonuclease III [Gammaproteobacteria bacterium]MDP6615843.1 ribonuclease III [Gammaproteobacteria bacterium]MDP6694339.1 ribonuclease III [Gammaproteobacteria bacterium]
MTEPGVWSRKHLQYEFKQAELLARALTHRSRSDNNNERLEFLGDAVLGLVIADKLHKDLPDSDEGSLSRQRAALVRKETLADISGGAGLGDAMLLGSGESRSGGHQRTSILADGLEAVFGAVYLDGGFEAATRVILHLYGKRLEDLPESEALKDPKTRLQEALQSAGHAVPVYDVKSEEGPPHARNFEVVCTISGLDISTTGNGSSRRKAEQSAATEALNILNNGNSGSP